LPERPPIIVVDNGSRDDTHRVTAAFKERVGLIRLERNMGAAARTAGARAARTPLLAFCDDDCWWAPRALSIAADRFGKNERLGVINARVLVRGDERIDPACEAMRTAGPRNCDGISIAYFMAGASIIRRDAYLEAGGYHERYHIGAEESLLSLDIAARGWNLWYCDDVVLYHYPCQLNRVPEQRRRLALRNRLWTMWLRLSASGAFRGTRAYITRARHDPIVREALYDALRGLPWIVRERKRIPAELERRIRAVAYSAFD
jgi:GT2 family glycosyltransferase